MFAAVSYDRLYFEGEKEKKADYEYKLSAGESIYIKEADGCIFSEVVSVNEIRKEKNCVWFDLDDTKSLTVRNRRDGDVIKTEGGTKKLKKLFIDEKVPADARALIPIVEYCGEIIWAAPFRRSSEYKINENTKKAVKIKYIRGKTNENA